MALVNGKILMSNYEIMRTDPVNWKHGVVYYCQKDPRIVVRNLAPFGWAWNFGHRYVYIAIVLAISAFFAPPFFAWQLGVRSVVALGIIAVLALLVVVFIASRLAQEPNE